MISSVHHLPKKHKVFETNDMLSHLKKNAELISSKTVSLLELFNADQSLIVYKNLSIVRYDHFKCVHM